MKGKYVLLYWNYRVTRESLVWFSNQFYFLHSGGRYLFLYYDRSSFVRRILGCVICECISPLFELPMRCSTTRRPLLRVRQPQPKNLASIREKPKDKCYWLGGLPGQLEPLPAPIEMVGVVLYDYSPQT